MKPTFIVLNIYKGQTFNDVLTFLDPDGVAIDLTGREARMHVREDIDSPNTLLELSSQNGELVVNGTGELAFNVSATVTSALPSGHEAAQWRYDLEWELPNGTVERPIEGVIVIWPEVTR
jgi:hypothetical protein